MKVVVEKVDIVALVQDCAIDLSEMMEFISMADPNKFSHEITQAVQVAIHAASSIKAGLDTIMMVHTGSPAVFIDEITSTSEINELDAYDEDECKKIVWN